MASRSSSTDFLKSQEDQRRSRSEVQRPASAAARDQGYTEEGLDKIKELMVEGEPAERTGRGGLLREGRTRRPRGTFRAVAPSDWGFGAPTEGRQPQASFSRTRTPGPSAGRAQGLG